LSSAWTLFSRQSILEAPACSALPTRGNYFGKSGHPNDRCLASAPGSTSQALQLSADIAVTRERGNKPLHSRVAGRGAVKHTGPILLCFALEDGALLHPIIKAGRWSVARVPRPRRALNLAITIFASNGAATGLRDLDALMYRKQSTVFARDGLACHRRALARLGSQQDLSSDWRWAVLPPEIA
jgi:hypothetical protein